MIPSEKSDATLAAKRQELMDKLLAKGDARAGRDDAIRPRATSAAVPLSFAQERLWFLDQFQPASPAYNIPMALRFTQPLNRDVLQRALDELVSRHESLRTTFTVADNRPVQVIEPQTSIRVRFTDLRGLSAEERAIETRRITAIENVHPFDLTQGPLLRAQLLRLGDAEDLLLVTLHHIVADGWSVGIFFQELNALYVAYLDGTQPRLPELDVQYADFALWQREHLQGDVLERLLDYWKGQLEDVPTILELPFDHPRPRVQTYTGKTQHFTVPQPVLDRLKALAQQEGATLFMVLMAAFQTLLHRFSGQDQFLVGTPIANRAKRELESLIGFFANTLVVRADMRDKPDVRTVIGRVRDTCIGAYAHQDLPFERLVQELDPERNLSHNPLFQTMFVLQNAPTGKIDPAALSSSAEPGTVTGSIARFDLLLAMAETAGTLFGSVEYSADLFADASIERLIRRLQAVLQQFADDPDVRLSEISTMTDQERAAVVARGHGVVRAYADSCVTALFEHQARQSPHARALEYGSAALTYQALDGRANQLARVLAGLGGGRGRPVAICVDRSLELVIAVLAVLKSGAPYLPLDASYPGERLEFMLADAGPSLLLTTSRLADTLPAPGIRKVLIDREAEGVGPLDDTPLDCAVSKDDPVYVLYTSGSTGRPKGVVMPHGAMSNLIQWQIHDSLAFGAARTLQFSSPCFDVSFQEIFSTLCSGGTLVMLRDADRQNMLGLLAAVRDHAVERLFLPFAALQQVAAAAIETGIYPSSLRDIITAGEQLQINTTLVTFFEHVPRCRLHNQYGPTEAHVVSEWSATGAPATWPALPPIGRPINNVRLHVVDEGLNPLPFGAPGQLSIGGVCLATGYLGRDDWTGERFVRAAPGTERMYLTGDRARMLDDGTVEFLGRLDHQVKVRGYRIEPGEVETAVMRHDGVREVAVVATAVPGSTQKRLVAFFVAPETAAITDRGLRAFVASQLPEFMVPSAFVKLDALPLTGTGKVDRRALGSSRALAPDVATEVGGARTSVERTLTRIWSDVLGTRQIAATDNFFDAGGHSLLATVVVSRIRDILSVDLPLRTAFEYPTIEQQVLQVLMARAGQLPHGDLDRVLRSLEEGEMLAAPAG